MDYLVVVELGTLSNDTTVANTGKADESQGPGARFHVRDSNEHKRCSKRGRV